MKLTPQEKRAAVEHFRWARERMTDADIAAADLVAHMYGVTRREVFELAFFGADGPRKPPAKAATARGGMLVQMPSRRSA